MFLILALLLQTASAVLIPFEDCLPDSYTSYSPTPLQWVPRFVDAVFDTENPTHNLRVTMWGNVTGATSNVTLPPASSPDWTDPTFTDGKILADPEPNAQNPKLTTLHSKVDVLTYEPWYQNTGFCNASLTNATCPLAPVFNKSELYVEPESPSARYHTI